jgi:uncharacterized caspase-like protein
MTRRALLLGCGKFADRKLAALRSPARDVAELERVLVNAKTGGYSVSSAIDCTSRQAQREIEGFFAAARPADPMNLLYLSCHGVQDKQGRLYFAFAETERDYLGSTAVSAEWVRECITSSRSKATLVLIDCCFSGAFIKGMRARSTGANVESLVQDLPQGSGVTVLTASGETEASFEDAEAADVRPSYFTDALIAGISTGAADLNRDGRVTADELYDYIYDRVKQGPVRCRAVAGAVAGALGADLQPAGVGRDASALAARARRLSRCLRRAADGFRLAVPFAEATIDDLEDGRSRARRASGTRITLRVLLWLVSPGPGGVS